MSFRLKTILGIAAIELILLSSLIFSSLSYLSKTNEQQIIERAETTASLFADASKDAVIAFDMATLISLVQGVQNVKSVAYARIIIAGESFAEGGDVNALSRPFKEDTALATVDDEVYDTFALVKENGEIYGRVEVGIAISPLQQLMTFARQQVVTIAAVEMVLTALFSLLLGGFLTKKINALRNGAHEVSSGNLSHRIKIKGKDEVAQTAQAFNEMCERLEAAHAELISAKEQAERSNEYKSRFLANMSHEVRTPLNVIIGMSHLCLQEATTDKQRNYLSKVHSSGHALMAIVNDVLDLSKIDADRMEIEEVDFDLYDLFDNLSEMLSYRADEKDIELLFDIPADLPWALRGDPVRLSQVLINLTGNAIKFTHVGQVIVSARTRSISKSTIVLEFHVRDTGIGITSVQRENLFDPFVQADTSTTRHYGGTGLGLAISKRIIELMDGDIWVDSKAGKGSSFCFYASFKPAHAGMLETFSLPSNSHVEGLNILVVDDSASARTIIGSLLAHNKIDHECARDADECYRLYQTMIAANKSPDLILLDWKMPNTDGVEVLQYLLERYQHLPPIVMMTAHQKDLLKSALEPVKEHVVSILEKPISAPSLLDIISHACGLNVSANPSSSEYDSYKQAVKSVKGANILLVEDNTANREVAADLLSRQQVHITIAENGEEAIARLQQGQFDAVLMDCQMPVMDGYQTTQWIRRNPRFSMLPVIAMSAGTSSDEYNRAINAGMNDFIHKPIVVQNLFKVLAKWVVHESANKDSRLDIALPLKPDAIANQLPSDQTDQPMATLDRHQGLENIGGDVERYSKLLTMFVDNEASLPDDIATALELDKDEERAAHHLHTLKGVAGTLGAFALMHCADRMELALSKQGTLYKEQMLELNQHVKELVHEIIDGETPEQASANDPKLTIQQLSSALENYDTEAESLVQKLMSQASAAKDPHRSTLSKIHTAIAEYDFDEAQEMLDTYISKQRLGEDDEL